MADLKQCVTDYLDAFKRKDVKALQRAARWSRQVGFSKERWSAEMSRQAKGDPELEKFIADAKATIKKNMEANQSYLERPAPWSPEHEMLRQAMQRQHDQWWKYL